MAVASKRASRARVSTGETERAAPPAGLRRSRPRSFEEWKALRRWGRMPAWEPPRPGYLLREAREAAGWTQSELAARLGVTQQAVARAESVASNPTVSLLEVWAEALGARLELAIRRNAEPSPRL